MDQPDIIASPSTSPRTLFSSQPDSTLTKSRRVRGIRRLEELLVSFTPFERLLLYVLSVILAVSAFTMLAELNKSIMVSVPAHSGSFSEGIVGTPRFSNPLLAISDADRDVTSLVYSGLLRADADGNFIPDLAESYTVSDDGKTYTFKIRRNAVFHDGKPLTSADVVYTVEAAQNPSVKSPKRADWEGVEVSAPDAQTVVFMLSHAYSPFLENTTLGILPKHLWQNVTPEEFSFHKLNTDPIGSGPYEVVRTTADSTGAPSVFYLAAFDRFTLGYPYISSIKLSFFPNSTALLKAYKAGTIEAVAGLEPSQLTQIDPDAQVLSAPLPRVFAIFFNQSQAPVFTDASVRKALNVAINKKEIIAKALGGYGKPIDGPIPPGVLNSDKLAAEEPAEDPIANAKSILEKGGWTFDESVHTWTKKTGKKTEQLTFAISTADTPELKDTAEAVASAWRALGANVTVHVFSTSDLNTSAIRPRDYDALLFGEIVGRSLDLFAFWHSSQRIDPGLNLALYANSKADTLLTEARALVDRRQREEDYVSFAKIVQGDNPAIFLYAPDFIYVLPKSVHGTMLGALTTPAERFLNVYQWYTETEQVWHLFTQDTATE